MVHLVTTVLTNAAFLPALARCVHRSLAYEAVLGVGVLVTSTLYHLGESTSMRVFGMNPGQW